MHSQTILDAMDGVALVLDPGLRIAAVGWPNWDAFLAENEGERRPREAILGRPFVDFITQGPLRDAYARVLADVLGRARPALELDYRCDGPAVKRYMRLSVTRLDEGGAVTGLLYQSVPLETVQRPPVPLLSRPFVPPETGDPLTLCAICARVAWPKGAPGGAREWIEAEDYYRRGGAAVECLSHGFCDACYRHLMAELDETPADEALADESRADESRADETRIDRAPPKG